MDKGAKGDAHRGGRGDGVTPRNPSAPEGAGADGEAGDLEHTLPERARNQEFFSRLSREEKQLLLLRNELYDGSWDEMEADLRNRLDRKPYIFRLMNRIEDDLARIDRLRAYEEEHKVDLGVFLGS